TVSKLFRKSAFPSASVSPSCGTSWTALTVGVPESRSTCAIRPAVPVAYPSVHVSATVPSAVLTVVALGCPAPHSEALAPGLKLMTGSGAFVQGPSRLLEKATPTWLWQEQSRSFPR